MNKETLYFLDPQNSTFYFYIYIVLFFIKKYFKI